MLGPGLSLTNRVNCGSILINNTFLPDVGIKIFSLSLRSAAFSVSLVALSSTVRMEMPLLFNSCFNPLMKSAFSLSGFADSIKIT